MYSQIDSNKRKSVLLIGVFIVFVLFLGWFFGQLYDYGYGGLVIALVISTGLALVSYYQGDKVALLTAGARSIAKEDNPYVYRLVENLAMTAGIPTPKVHLMADPAINAFATGRDPAHASIAITTGAVEKLENEELEGVIAHELSHVKNYDIRLMTIVIVLVGLIALLSDFFFRARFFGGGRRDNNNSGGVLLIIGVLLMILSPLIAKLIQLAVSRKREFLADASGALLTRYPEGLARALEKIAQEHLPTARATTATAHLYFANPLSPKLSLAKLFATHPPISERVTALRSMA